MKRYLQIRAMILVLLLAIFGLIALMVSSGKLVRNSYSQPDEPRNAYLVHMFERGMRQDQVFCSDEPKCVVMTYSGMPMMTVQTIGINGETYFESLVTAGIDYPVAAGVYCTGGVDMYGCYKLTILTEGESCPAEIEYLGYRAPLVAETCLEYK